VGGKKFPPVKEGGIREKEHIGQQFDILTGREGVESLEKTDKGVDIENLRDKLSRSGEE